MLLTHEHLKQAESKNGGWSEIQLSVLGETLKNGKGWKHRLVGKDFEQKLIERFIQLKDAHLKQKQILEDKSLSLF